MFDVVIGYFREKKKSTSLIIDEIHIYNSILFFSYEKQTTRVNIQGRERKERKICKIYETKKRRIASIIIDFCWCNYLFHLGCSIIICFHLHNFSSLHQSGRVFQKKYVVIII
jgi:hypothetical protein